MRKKAESNGLSRRDRNRLIEWGGKFLRTVSTNADVMREMVKGGYSLETNRQGWKLYVSMMGGGDGRYELQSPAHSLKQEQAKARVAAFAEELRKLKPVISHYHPKLVEPLFPKVSASWDAGVVLLFVGGYDWLQNTGAEREDIGKQCRDAIQLLARFNMTQERIHALRVDGKLAAELPDETEILLMPCTSEQLEEAAMAFQKWLSDWRFIAQQHVTRRDHRILMGVSRPRRQLATRNKEGEVEQRTSGSGHSPSTSNC